jgi:hypothetical protein
MAALIYGAIPVGMDASFNTQVSPVISILKAQFNLIGLAN